MSVKRSPAGLILPDEPIEIDVDAFDRTIGQRGVPMIHYRAIKCPCGLIDPADVRRTHEDHAGCSNGFIYRPIGRLRATLTSNQTGITDLDIGLFDGSTVVATFARYYDHPEGMPEKRVLVRPYDRFFLDQADIHTATWEVTKRRLDGRPDRLEFPALHVENLIDSNLVEYVQNIDFELTADGDILWRTDKGPAVGTVYTAWFVYRPHWYVQRLVHDVRVFPITEYANPEDVRLERIGSGAILVREYMHRTTPPDAEAPTKTKDNQQLPPDSDLV